MGLAADQPDPGRRIGIFGGTFDPPHRGHVSVTREAIQELELDELWWVPAGTPPHKTKVFAAASLRLEMARRAAEAVGDPRVRVLGIEVEEQGPSFTVDTLRRLRERELGAGEVPILVIGIDQFADFDQWKAPREILAQARLAVMDRDGSGLDSGLFDGRFPSVIRGAPDREQLEERIIPLPVTRVDISSTEVRRRVAAGEAIEDLVPEAVAQVITREGLYQP